jgi:hypothetical protein
MRVGYEKIRVVRQAGANERGQGNPDMESFCSRIRDGGRQHRVNHLTAVWRRPA